jgi:hypothetical protein
LETRASEIKPGICHIKDQYLTHGCGMMYLIAVPSQALRRQWAEQLVQQGQYPFINVREGSFTQDDIVQVNTYEVILESLLNHLHRSTRVLLVVDEIQIIREEYRSPVINAMLRLIEKYQDRGACLCMGSDFSEENIGYFTDMNYGLVHVEHTRFPENIQLYTHGQMDDLILWEYLTHLDSCGLAVVFMNTKREII